MRSPNRSSFSSPDSELLSSFIDVISRVSFQSLLGPTDEDCSTQAILPAMERFSESLEKATQDDDAFTSTMKLVLALTERTRLKYHAGRSDEAKSVALLGNELPPLNSYDTLADLSELGVPIQDLSHAVDDSKMQIFDAEPDADVAQKPDQHPADNERDAIADELVTESSNSVAVRKSDEMQTMMRQRKNIGIYLTVTIGGFSKGIRIICPGHEHVFLPPSISIPILSIDFGYVMNMIITPAIPSESRPHKTLLLIQATSLESYHETVCESTFKLEPSKLIGVDNVDALEPFTSYKNDAIEDADEQTFPLTCEDDDGSLEALIKQKMTKKSTFDPTLVTEREQRNSFYLNLCVAVSDEVLSLLPVSNKGMVAVHGRKGSFEDIVQRVSTSVNKSVDGAGQHLAENVDGEDTISGISQSTVMFTGCKPNVGLSTIILDFDLTAIRMAIASLHDKVFQSTSSIPGLPSQNNSSIYNDSAISHSNPGKVNSKTGLDLVRITPPTWAQIRLLDIYRATILGIHGSPSFDHATPSRLIEIEEDESEVETLDITNCDGSITADVHLTTLSICEDDEGSLDALMKQIKTKKSAFDPTLVTVRERRNSFYSNRLVAVGDEVLALLPASRKGVVVVNGCEGEVQDDDSGDSRNCIRIADEASKHNERITALQVRNLGLGSKEKMEFSTAIRIVVPGHEHVFLRAAISRPIISVDFGYVMNISPIIPSQSRPILNLHIIEATPLALNNDKFYERGVDFESSRFIEVNNEDFVEDGPFNVVGSMIFPSTCEDDEGSLEALMKQKMTKKSKFDPTLVTEREQRKSFYSNRCAAVSDEILSLLPVSTKGIVAVNGRKGSFEDVVQYVSAGVNESVEGDGKHLTFMGYKRNVGLSTIILESDLTAIRMAIAGLHDMVFQSASSIPTLSSHNTVSDSNDSAVSHSNAVSVTSPTRLPISLSKDNLKLCRTIISGIAGRRLLNCTMPSRLIENHEDESWDDVPDVGERNSAKIVDSEALSICEDDEGSLETLIKHLRTKKSDFDPTLVTVRERRNSFYANLLTAVSDEVIALLPALRKGVVVVNGFEGDV